MTGAWHNQGQRLDEQVQVNVAGHRSVGEQGVYRTVWDYIVVMGTTSKPWILLRKDGRVDYIKGVMGGASVKYLSTCSGWTRQHSFQ